MMQLSANYFSILDDDKYAETTPTHPVLHQHIAEMTLASPEHLHPIDNQQQLYHAHQGQGETEGHEDDASSVGTGASTQDESAYLVSRSFTTSTREVTTRGATAVKVTQKNDLDISATTRDGTVAVGIGNQAVTNGNENLSYED